MLNEGMMKMWDILMLWGVILTMMGILGIIQMGLLEKLSDFIIYGLIFVVAGIILLVGLSLAEKSKAK